MTDIPKVRLGDSDIHVTRIISGGNPLCGNSHTSPEMSADMRDYFTPEQVVAYLHGVQASGINTIQARGDYHRVMYWLELFRREDGKLHWIAQTASEMADVFNNIRVIASFGADAIYHHGTKTDRMWNEGRIDRVEDYLKCMRDQGVQVGMASHIPEVFDYAEDKGWDLDFYMTCFYNLSRKKRESALVGGSTQKKTDEEYPPGDPPRICRFIRSTQKTCLAFKILAASRKCDTQEEVREAFHWTFRNIKPTDAVVVGMFPKYDDQIRLNVEHTLAACSQTTARS